MPDYGFVYLIRAGKTNSFKIGSTSDIPGRIRSLQTACPNKIGYVHSIYTADPIAVERRLHKAFGSSRLILEWFELSDEQVKTCIACMNIDHDADAYRSALAAAMLAEATDPSSKPSLSGSSEVPVSVIATKLHSWLTSTAIKYMDENSAIKAPLIREHFRLCFNGSNRRITSSEGNSAVALLKEKNLIEVSGNSVVLKNRKNCRIFV